MSIRFKFPSILLVYFLMGPIALGVVFFINFAGQESLLCRSSEDLIEIIEYSTPFCSFLGIILLIISTISEYIY